MDSIDVFIRVNKEDIYLICPYFEAFEGMVSIRTPKPETGPKATIKLMVSPDFKKDFDKLLESFKRRIDFELLTPAPLSIKWRGEIKNEKEEIPSPLCGEGKKRGEV